MNTSVSRDDERESLASLAGPFKEDQIGYLVRLARWRLNSLFGKREEEPKSPRRIWGPAFVNVTIFRDGQLCGSKGAQAGNIPDAVLDATRKATLDERFGHFSVAGDLECLAIELSIQLESSLLSQDRFQAIRDLELGKYGVRISVASASAYYKPSVPLTSSIETAYELLNRLCGKAGIPEMAWLDPRARLERSVWVTALENLDLPAGFVVLQKQRAAGGPVSHESVSRAAKASVGHLVAIQKSDGSFGYLYEPFKDKWLPGMNQVRQAGCAYALSRACAHSIGRMDGTLQSARARALDYLLTCTASSSYAAARFVWEEQFGLRWGRLGATALTVLAAQSAGMHGTPEYDQLTEHLIRSQEDDGSFTCFVGGTPTAKQMETSQNFAPGEAILALAEHTHITGDARGYAAAGKAFAHYREHFSTNPATAFIVWQTDAWCRIAMNLLRRPTRALAALVPGINEIADFVFQQIDWLLPLQYSAQANCPDDYVGGYKMPQAPSFSTAVLLEAIVRGCDLATAMGDNERAQAYRESGLSCLQFLSRLQIRRETARLFARPKLVVGGLTTTLENFQMRCDYEQHMITATLTAIDSGALWI